MLNGLPDVCVAGVSHRRHVSSYMTSARTTHPAQYGFHMICRSGWSCGRTYDYLDACPGHKPTVTVLTATDGNKISVVASLSHEYSEQLLQAGKVTTCHTHLPPVAAFAMRMGSQLLHKGLVCLHEQVIS